MLAVSRQVAAAAVMALALVQVRPWLAGIDHTSVAGALRLLAVLVPAGVVYAGVVTVLGGREVRTLLATIRPGARG